MVLELYVSDREGSDATGDGTKEKPFKTGLKYCVMFKKCLFSPPYPRL
ncbi:NARS isoform 11 [Pongo abelii]|uniref:NARS isoform 11 n=1 Tax=Pongo abelii TaxID=9601 RepID=A0A2J8W365_PONAB|nr:NARS isoform 11 [Pongo abelii]